MSAATFWMNPANLYDAGGTKPRIGTYSDIDDPWDAPDGITTKLKQRADSAVGTYTGFASFGLTAPTSGLTINWIRVHYHIWRECSGGVGNWNGDQEFAGSIRPAASATYYTSTTRTIVDAAGSLVTSGTHGVKTLPHYNTSVGAWSAPGTGPAHVYWQYDSDPSGGSWDVAKLQALLACFAFDVAKGSPNALYSLTAYNAGVEPGVCVTLIGVEVNANSPAGSIEEKRLVASAHLRLFRSGVDPIVLRLPAYAADADVGDIVSLAHELGPSADGLGWGLAPWQRHQGIVFSKDVDLSSKTVLLEMLDARAFHCGLSFPAITDLPYTEEGQGVPYLDAGGGRTMSRIATNAGSATTKGYVRRQTADSSYVEVPINKEKWSPDGLAVFRESYAALPNNSFSQGAGTTFTGWTNVVSGGSIAESTAKYLFDVSGLRRSALLTSTGGLAGFTRATASLGATGSLRVHVIAERSAGSTAANLAYRLVASDGQYWNDSSGAWQAGSVDNPLTAMSVGTAADTHSKVITSRGTGTYTLHVYAIAGTDAMYLYYANLWWGASATGGASSSGVDMRRPPFVTTTVAAYEGQDLLTVANPLTARAWNPAQGTGLLQLMAAWDNADMEVGGYTGASPSKVRVCAMSYVDGSNYDLVGYYKVDGTTSSFFFKRRVGGTDYAALCAVTGADRPTLNSTISLAWRWQETGGELGGAAYALKLFVAVDGRTPLTATATAVAWAPTATTIYLGCGFSAQWDGWARDFEVVPYVLDDTEVYRRMGV